MDIRHLINLLPHYYKELDSYKVDGKGLLERFLEIIGVTLYNTKDTVDRLIDVISIDKTKKENLDLLANNLGSIPFTGSNVIESLKLTYKQRRDLISISTWLIKNRGSKEFFTVLFNKLHNSENNLSIEISEKSNEYKEFENSILDYYSEVDSINLDTTDVVELTSVVIYKVTGNLSKSVYKSICDLLMDWSPFNVLPLIYINGEFQTRLDTPYQLAIEYFDIVSKSWKAASNVFQVGSEINHFRVVAYNTITHKEVNGIKFTSKFASNKQEFTGINKNNVLVTPYYYEIASLPNGVSKFSRTFIPELTIPSSGELVGNDVSIEYHKVNSSINYKDTIEVFSLFDTMSISNGIYELPIRKYTSAVIAVRASREYNGITKPASVVHTNTDNIEGPFTIWYNKGDQNILYTNPNNSNYIRLDNVSIFKISQFTDHTFMMLSNRSKHVTVRVKESTEGTVVGKVLVRQNYPIKTDWTDDLKIQVTEDQFGNKIIPKIDIFVQNPHVPSIWLEDGTLLTQSRLFNLILYGTFDTRFDMSGRNSQELLLNFIKEVKEGSTWKIVGTSLSGYSFLHDSESKPLQLPFIKNYSVVSAVYPGDIVPANITFSYISSTRLKFSDYSSTTKYLTTKGSTVTLSAKIIKEYGNDPEFKWNNVILFVKSPSGDTSRMILDGNKEITNTLSGTTLVYKEESSFNTIDIITKVPGEWLLIIENPKGANPLIFSLIDAIEDNQTNKNPAYIKLVPSGNTSSNTSWKTGDTESSIVLSKDGESCTFNILVLDSNKKSINFTGDIMLESPDKNLSVFKNQVRRILSGVGTYTFSIGQVKHTLNILDKPITVYFNINPTEITEGSSPLETTVNIQTTEPGIFLARYTPETGSPVEIFNGQKFIAPGPGTYELKLYRSDKIVPGKVCIFKINSKSSVHNGLDEIILDNSDNSMDMELSQNRVITKNPSENRVIRIINLETDKEWIATLEDL